MKRPLIPLVVLSAAALLPLGAGAQISVPGDYPTIIQALQFGTDIVVTANITENIVISSMSGVTITGSTYLIRITGQATITNSTVVFRNIRFVGTTGADGISCWSIYPDPECAPGASGDGGDALVATGSTISLIRSIVQGGSPGIPGTCWYQCQYCSSYQEWGQGAWGSAGEGITASLGTLIDTQYVTISSAVLDGTSSIVSGHTVPTTPALVSPANGAIDQPLSLVLVWNSAASFIDRYLVEAASNAAMTNMVLRDSSASDTARLLSLLAHETTYYWRVKAHNFAGWGNYSTVSSFVTIAAEDNDDTDGPQDCGCGAGTGAALLPPLWFKWRAVRKRKKTRKNDGMLTLRRQEPLRPGGA
ncbi:MAG: fibronectin type III domain-containing protein [Chitinispirillaceae bacterium]|nr:fibronectin type III domain-containing protein [Chitinispirillaceae bacterium]